MCIRDRTKLKEAIKNQNKEKIFLDEQSNQSGKPELSQKNESSNQYDASHSQVSTLDRKKGSQLSDDMEMLHQEDSTSESAVEVEYIILDKEEEPMLIDPDDQIALIEKIKSMSRDEVQDSISKMISKKSLNTKKFAESSVVNQLETSLTITRYFYSKKNPSKDLLDVVGFLKCNLSFKTEEREYESYTITGRNKSKKVIKKLKEEIVSIERDSPIDPDFQYRFSYKVVSEFNESYVEYCRQVDNFIEPMKYMLKNFKQEDEMALDAYLGKKIEDLIRKNNENFKAFSNLAFETSTNMLENIQNIDCNLKDMMAFYDLLPRFFLLYKRMKEKLEVVEDPDPIVLYYRDQLVEIHQSWLDTNNELFGYIGAFNTWLILNQGLFKMAYSFPSDDLFKINMMEMMAKSMIELTLEKDRYRTSIRNVLLKYKEIYNQIRDFFEGLEEYLYIKVPFDFPKLITLKVNSQTVSYTHLTLPTILLV